MKRLFLFMNLLIAFSVFSGEYFVKANGIQLFCNVVGEGKPLIVIHGGPGLSQQYLLPYMAKLGDHHKVVFYDQRASGKSEGSLENISIEQFVDDIEGLRKSLGFEKVSILGHSWGGFLAMRYAIKYPDSVDNLVLLNTACLSSADLRVFLDEWYRRMAPFMDSLQAIGQSKEFADGDPEAVANYMKIIFRTYCFSAASVDKLNIISTVDENIKWNGLQKILNNILVTEPFDLTEDLKKVDCKTLIIHGDADPIPIQAIENIHQCIRNSKVVILKDCGHFPYVEKADELFDSLNGFLLN